MTSKDRQPDQPEAQELGEVGADVDTGATARVVGATMDGLQLQWLLEPGSVDMAEATAVAITRLIGRELPPVEQH